MGRQVTPEGTSKYTYPVVNMGIRLREMERVLEEMARKDIFSRIWRKDYTVWKPDPSEISNRLGWLQIIDPADDRVREIEKLALEIREAGFHHVVLLGMGGSSLGPEVLRKTFGSGAGYPVLIVLDSTHPAWVEEVARAIEPEHTLFLISSKSGSTIETQSLYRYFRSLVESRTNEKEAGRNFIAITDPQTILSRLALDKNFRRTYLNPEDIGGRYSVLSYFGLLPAALAGIDIRRILERAARMQERCAACTDIYQNPGAWLGALIGSLALHGRNKLTFIISPAVSSFGLWVEQLIAESTGKKGKGILPIIAEPQSKPVYYGDDRLFAYLRMKGDENAETDEFVMQLEAAGHPIIQIEIEDQYDLGAEFFRWEFATAVAGAVLGINPFDQPDVQATKTATQKILKANQTMQTRIQMCEAPGKWLKQAGPDNYLAILAYLKQTPAVDRAFSQLRGVILEKYHLPTTLGYGPRYLHSTGQFHKGGLNQGLFLEITASRQKDLPIPGEDYTFGKLTEAEALGDYQALESSGRRVSRIQLSSASGASISRLARELERT